MERYKSVKNENSFFNDFSSLKESSRYKQR
jgi:hypothetical protein